MPNAQHSQQRDRRRLAIEPHPHHSAIKDQPDRRDATPLALEARDPLPQSNTNSPFGFRKAPTGLITLALSFRRSRFCRSVRRSGLIKLALSFGRSHFGVQ